MSDERVKGPASYFPSECLGRTEAMGESYTLDGTWTPMDGMSVFAFYTYSRFSTDQASRSWASNNPAQAVSEAQDWKASLKYTDNTAGLGLRYTPSSRQWDAGAQYVYSDGKGRTSVSAGSALTAPAAVPDTSTKLDSLQVYGKYAVNKNVLLRFNYAYERLRTDDWAFDNATPVSSNNVVLTGHQSPNYTANVFGVSVAYTGW